MRRNTWTRNTILTYWDIRELMTLLYVHPTSAKERRSRTQQDGKCSLTASTSNPSGLHHCHIQLSDLKSDLKKELCFNTEEEITHTVHLGR